LAGHPLQARAYNGYPDVVVPPCDELETAVTLREVSEMRVIPALKVAFIYWPGFAAEMAGFGQRPKVGHGDDHMAPGDFCK